MEQLTIYDVINEDKKIQKPIRLIELFAGIGSQAKALENLGVEFEHYRVCEFDKYAIASYNAIHGTNFETSDIRKIHAADLGIVNTSEYEYILTYSFPCQDLSLAGKQRGMVKGSGTRSGLLWEVERLLDECKEKPQILLMENVTQVHSNKNIEDFKSWINKLESLGYQNYWQDLNAKDYGMPQNRNRCFMVSILGNYNYKFPKKKKLKLKLKDFLQDNTNGKYNLQKAKEFFINHSFEMEAKGNGFRFEPHIKKNANIAKCITTNAGNRMDDNFVMEADFDCEKFIFDTTNNYIQKVDKSYFISNSMKKYIVQGNEKLNIRKLTPKECYRLMGFNDNDFEKASKVNSNAQLYKQAGNSIVVNVLEEIFKQLL